MKDKKKHIKRISLVLTLVLAVSFAGILLASCEGPTVRGVVTGDLRYDVVKGKAVITEYLGSEETVNIPDRLGNYAVTGLGDKCFFEDEFKYISLPSTLKTLGKGSFKDMKKLKSVVIPAGVEAIPAECFMGAFASDSGTPKTPSYVVMPDTVTSIGESAFEDAKISQIYFSQNLETIGSKAFKMTSSSLKSQLHKNPDYDKDDPDSSEYTVNQVTESNEKVNSRTFRMPSSLKTIGYQAFYRVSSASNTYVNQFQLPYEIETIEGGAFTHCHSASEFIVFYKEDSTLVDTTERFNFTKGKSALMNKDRTILISYTSNTPANTLFASSSGTVKPDYKDLKEIAPYAFGQRNYSDSSAGSDDRTLFYIPVGVEKIGAEAFAEFKNTTDYHERLTFVIINKNCSYGASTFPENCVLGFAVTDETSTAYQFALALIENGYNIKTTRWNP